MNYCFRNRAYFHNPLPPSYEKNFEKARGGWMMVDADHQTNHRDAVDRGELEERRRDLGKRNSFLVRDHNYLDLNPIAADELDLDYDCRDCTFCHDVRLGVSLFPREDNSTHFYILPSDSCTRCHRRHHWQHHCCRIVNHKQGCDHCQNATGLYYIPC